MEQQLQKLTQAILARGELLEQLQIQCAAILASVEEMKPIRPEVKTETKSAEPVVSDPFLRAEVPQSVTPPAQASSSRSLATGELDHLMPARCSKMCFGDDTALQKSALMPDAALGPPLTAAPLDIVITNIEPIVDALLVQDDTCVLTSTPSDATFHSIDLGDKHVPKLCYCQLGARKLFDEMLIRSTVVLWPPPMKWDERQLWPPPSRWVIKCSGEELRPTPWPLFTCNRVGLQLKSPWPPPEQNRAMGSVAQQSTPWLSLKCYWNVTPPDWQDSVGIITLLVINSTISFIEENNAGNAAAALMAGLAAKAKVLRDGRWTEEEAAILVPQDIVSIKLGDIIPADARLLEGDPLKIDQSALTGESLPVTKGPSDGVYSGSTVKRGEIEANEIAPGVHTLIGKAAHLVDSTNQVGQFQKVLTAIWNFCICSIVVGMFDSVTFRRTQESAARHEDLQQKTGLVEAIIVEIQDRDKVGGSYLHSDAICCTPELDKEKSCKVGEVIIRPNPGNPDWPKRIQTFFDGKNEEILMVTQSVSINKTGMYYLYFMFCDPQHKGLKIIGRTVWRNPHGYLPGKMAPMMTFCGFMSLAYLVLGLLWFLQFVRCWKDILQLHYHITAVIALGMCEMAFWYFEYANFNSTGTRPMGITLWAVTFTAVKKTVSRLLLLVVSMGYGVVRPTLGGITSRVAALGVIYFIASEALELVENLGNINDFSGKTRLFLVLPVAILDATFIIWIFSSLSRTLEKLQLRRSMAKLELYRKFTNSLAMAVHILEENLVKMVGANENVGYKKNRKPADIHCGTGANSGVFSEDSVTVGDLVVKDQEVIEAIREPSITFMVAKEEPLTYFTSLGYQCPDHVNPAEFLDDLISIDYSSAKSVQSSQKWIENLIEEFANKVPITECSISVTKSEGAEFSDKHVQKSSAKRRHGCWRQFRLLFKRAWMQIFRDGPTNKVRARMSVASAIIFGSVFWRMGKTQTFIQQDGTSSGGCHKHSNGCTDKDSESFPEGTGYNRERAKGSYALGPYLSSKWLAEIPIGAAFPLILGSILYPMAILLYRLGVKPHFKERGMSRTGLAVGWLGFGLRRGPGPGGKRGIQLGLEKTGDSDGSSRKKHYGLASALFYLQLLLPPNPLL